MFPNLHSNLASVPFPFQRGGHCSECLYCFPRATQRRRHKVRVQTQFTLALNIPACPRLPEASLATEGQEGDAPCPGLPVSYKQQTAPWPYLCVLIVRRKPCGPRAPAGVSRCEQVCAEFCGISSFQNDDLFFFHRGKKKTHCMP